jgi:peptidoglycan/LPS O-acetylase OafA/YrhL
MKVGSIETTSALVIAYLALSVVYIAGGAFSQLIGRRTYLLAASVCAATLGTLCYYLLLNTAPGDLPRVMLLTTLTTVLVVAPGALGTVYVNERFRTTVRASGFGLGYSLAIILPAFYVFYQTWLSYLMPFKYTVLVLVVVGAVLVFVGAALGPETKGVDFGSPAPGAEK